MASSNNPSGLMVTAFIVASSVTSAATLALASKAPLGADEQAFLSRWGGVLPLVGLLTTVVVPGIFFWIGKRAEKKRAKMAGAEADVRLDNLASRIETAVATARDQIAGRLNAVEERVAALEEGATNPPQA